MSNDDESQPVTEQSVGYNKKQTGGAAKSHHSRDFTPDK